MSYFFRRSATKTDRELKSSMELVRTNVPFSATRIGTYGSSMHAPLARWRVRARTPSSGTLRLESC